MNEGVTSGHQRASMALSPTRTLLLSLLIPLQGAAVQLEELQEQVFALTRAVEALAGRVESMELQTSQRRRLLTHPESNHEGAFRRLSTDAGAAALNLHSPSGGSSRLVSSDEGLSITSHSNLTEVTGTLVVDELLGNGRGLEGVQRRVSDPCSPGSCIRAIGSIGDVTCQAVGTVAADDFAALQSEVATLRHLIGAITPPPAAPPPPPAGPLPYGCAQIPGASRIVCDSGPNVDRILAVWTVPGGVTTLMVKGWGCGGSSGVDGHAGDGYQYPQGGGGGAFAGILVTTPGEELTLAINLYCPPHDEDVCGDSYGRSGGGSGYTGIFRQAGAGSAYSPVVIAAGGGGGGQNDGSNGGAAHSTSAGSSASGHPYLTGEGANYPYFQGGAGLPGGNDGAYASSAGGGGRNYLVSDTTTTGISLYAGSGVNPGNPNDADRQGAGTGGRSTEPPSGGGTCGRCNIDGTCNRKFDDGTCVCIRCSHTIGWGLGGGRLILDWSGSA